MLSIFQPLACGSGLGHPSPAAVQEGDLLGRDVALLRKEDGVDGAALLLPVELESARCRHVLEAAGGCGGGDGRGRPLLPVWVRFLPSAAQLDLVDLERILAAAVTTVHRLGGGSVLRFELGIVGLGVVRPFDAFGGVVQEGRDDRNADCFGEMNGRLLLPPIGGSSVLPARRRPLDEELRSAAAAASVVLVG